MKYIILLITLTLFISCDKKASENNDIKDNKKVDVKKVELKKEVKASNLGVKRADGFQEFKAPQFSLKNTTGDTINLSDYKGKVVLLDFWGTWCPPCRKMIPVLSSFVNQCSKEGVVLIGIHSSGNSPGPEAIDDFAGKMGVNYPMLLGTQETEKAYGVRGFPSLFLIGRDGMVKHKFVGMHPVDEIRKYVRPEIEKK
jgi:peroxiredoxin